MAETVRLVALGTRLTETTVRTLRMARAAAAEAEAGAVVAPVLA